MPLAQTEPLAISELSRFLLGLFIILVLIASSIWSLYFVNRSENRDRRINAYLFSAVIHLYLMIFFAGLIDFDHVAELYLPLIFCVVFFMTTSWLLHVSYSVLKLPSYRTMRRYLIVLDILFSLVLLTNPYHHLFNDGTDLQYLSFSIGLYFLLFYAMAKLLFGLFIYYAFPITKIRIVSVSLFVGTALYLLYVSYLLQSVNFMRYLPILLITPFYYGFLIEMTNFGQKLAPTFLRSSLFDHAQFKIAIFDRSGMMNYLSPSLEHLREVLEQWDLDTLRHSNATSNLLELPEQNYYQWTCNPLQNGYLVDLEDISDLMQKITEKNSIQKELSKKKTVMAAQSNLEKEMMITDYRLQLHETLEVSSKDVLMQIRRLLKNLRPEAISQLQVDEIKLWSRYFKRKSLYYLKDMPEYDSYECKMAFYELLEISQPERFSVMQNTPLAKHHFEHIHDMIHKLALLTLGTESWVAVTIQAINNTIDVRCQIESDQELPQIREKLTALNYGNIELDQDTDTLRCRYVLED